MTRIRDRGGRTDHARRTPEARARRNEKRKLRRAAQRERERAQGVPEGMRLRGVSTLYGEGGQAGGHVGGQWVKTERDSEEPPKYAVPAGHGPTATLVDGQGQIRAQWLGPARGAQDKSEAWLHAMRQTAELPARSEPVPAPEWVDDDWLCAYPIGDAHLGLLAHATETGEHHDLAIGSRDLLGTFDLLVGGAPHAARALCINLGDYWHAQDDLQRTPGHGHKLDVDGRADKVRRRGLEVLEGITARLLAKHAHVEWWTIPGNHDPDAAVWTALWLETRFRDDARVIIRSAASPHQCLEFGRNMICSTHGHSLRRDQVPGYAASRWAEIWGRTVYRRAFTGHVHHETVKEHAGMVVESARTVAAKDYYHVQHGYDAGRSLDVIGFHKQWGPRVRNTIGIHEVRSVHAGQAAG